MFLSIFLDMEKAYDTTWRYGILRDLSEMGVRGNMLNTIESYLSERSFSVRIGNVYSQSFTQETGVPQGGVLSCTLFIVKMNSLHGVIPRTVFYSVYVDDLQIGYRSCNLGMCERQLQLCVNKLANWAEHNGFKFSPHKSTCMLFTNKRGLSLEPVININGVKLSVSLEHKFLGIILDTKLTFVPYLKHLKARCLKTMNLLKLLS